MTSRTNFPGMLAFQAQALRMQAERRWFWGGVACFSVGFLAYALVRNYVYAVLPEIMAQPSEPLGFLLRLDLIPALLFLTAVYVPGLILLGNAISGRGRGFAVSEIEYRLHVSALLPLWGTLYLVAAPVQWIAPHFLGIGMLEISVGMLIRSILIGVYTVWVVKHLNMLTAAQALGVFVLSWFMLLLFLLMVHSYWAVLFIAVAALIGLFFRRLRKRRGDPVARP